MSFIFSKFKSTEQIYSFNCRGDFHALVETPFRRIYFMFYHTRGGFNFKKSLLIFCFDTLDLKLFDF